MTPRNQCCNLCDPNMALPWANVAPVDFAELEDIIDSRYILLQAIHWNQSLEQQPYRAPYGSVNLSYLLTGNKYMLGKHEQDPVKRARRVGQAESSPYFGVLEFLPGKEQTVRTYLDELVDQGFVGHKVYQFESGGSYNYPILLPLGLERLQEGIRFEGER